MNRDCQKEVLRTVNEYRQYEKELEAKGTQGLPDEEAIFEIRRRMEDKTLGIIDYKTELGLGSETPISPTTRPTLAEIQDWLRDQYLLLLLTDLRRGRGFRDHTRCIEP